MGRILPVGILSTVVVRACARDRSVYPTQPSLVEGCDGRPVSLSNPFRATPVEGIYWGLRGARPTETRRGPGPGLKQAFYAGVTLRRAGGPT